MFEYEFDDGLSSYGDDDYDDRGDYEYEEEFTPETGMYRTGNGDMVWAFQGEVLTWLPVTRNVVTVDDANTIKIRIASYYHIS